MSSFGFDGRGLKRRDFGWGVAAQALNLGFMLILLPVILRRMTRAEVGIWLIFLVLANLAQLLDMGFQGALARNLTFVFAGAQRVIAIGVDSDRGEFNPALYHNVVLAGRYIYRRISVVALVLLWGGGTLYLRYVTPKEIAFPEVAFAWGAYSGGLLLNFYFGHLNAILQGRGDLRFVNICTVVSKLAQLTFSVIAVLYFGGGLLALGLCSIGGVLLNRCLAIYFLNFRKPQEFELSSWLSRGVKSENVSAVVSALSHNASRYGLALIGAFLIGKCGVLIAASRIGVAESAGYALAIQILSVIQSVSALPLILSLPKISYLRAENDTGSLRRLFGAVLVVEIGLFGVGSTFTLFFGNDLLSSFGSSTRLPAFCQMAVLSFVYLLEVNHGACANLLAASNKVPFGPSSVYTGVAVIGFSWFAVPHFGLWAMIWVVALCQACFNNWKWPVEAARELECSFYLLLRIGIREVLLGLHTGRPG